MTSPLSADPFAAVRRFYTHALGCRPIAGASEYRLPMTLHGQSLVLERGEGADASISVRLPADGLVLGVDEWCDVEERLRSQRVATSISVPRPLGTGPGQQCLMEVHDPLGNAIALRGFAVSAATLAA